MRNASVDKQKQNHSVQNTHLKNIFKIQSSVLPLDVRFTTSLCFEN